MLLPSQRFVPQPRPPTRPLLLLDVMDTVIVDPFFRGFHRDLFGLGSVESLFAVKDRASFVAFECGEIDEAEHFATYFCDRREVDGERIKAYMRERYAWVPGMRELLTELRGLGVQLATCSNYPAPWAPLVEEATGLSSVVPWAFISGECGSRKPSRDAFAAALDVVGCAAGDVLFVDDASANCEGAREAGIEAVRFESAAQLRAYLRARHFPQLLEHPD